MTAFSKQLIAFRMEQRWSQKTAAKFFEVTMRTYGSYERGESAPYNKSIAVMKQKMELLPQGQREEMNALKQTIEDLRYAVELQKEYILLLKENKKR